MQKYINGEEEIKKLKQRLDTIFKNMRLANSRNGTPSLVKRYENLDAIEAMVKENKSAIIAAINDDFGGRSEEETLLAEIFTILSCVRHTRTNLAKWVKPTRRHVDLAFKPATAKIIPQPLGIIGIISPWNYPLYLALSPLVGALAAGNRAMLKPSEISPHTAALLSKMIEDNFSPDDVFVIQGGWEIGEAFSKLPFDHLIYTGSPGVGQKVMAEAAANLTPVTLELGGKSPAIIGPQSVMANAVKSIVRGKMFNAGQTCVAPDYVLVPEYEVDNFATQSLAAAQRFYPSLVANDNYSAIISHAHYGRLQSMLSDAKTKGATIISATEGVGRKFPFTLLLDTKENMTVRRDEIFGPLLPVIPYKDLDAAISFVNKGRRPLALYVFDRNAKNFNKVLTQTISGGAVVNDCLMHAAMENLPFGGVGESGMGHYHGQDGFKTFSKFKPVVYQSRFNGMWLLHPPYGAAARGLIKFLLKR